MRFVLAMTLLLRLTRGFVVVGPTCQSLFRLGSSTPPAKDYDDWYADFNPADFDEADGSGGARGSGARGSTGSTRSTTSARTTSGTRTTYGSTNNYSTNNNYQSHDYTRDPSDNSNVNEAVVNQLIQERLTARKTGQFDQADAVRDVLLREHGVSVWDKDKVWRSGSSSSGSGMRGGGRAADRDSHRGAGRGTSNDRGGRGTSNDRGTSFARPQRDFGPNGHDYQLSYEAGPNNTGLAEPQIHRMIADRLKCKMARDFNGADAIQQDLLSAGVFVHDGRKEWRADGKGFGDFPSAGGKPGRDAGSRSDTRFETRLDTRMDRNKPYEQSQFSLQTDSATIIQDLVEERVDAKRSRDFSAADAIRDELLQDYNVLVDDRNRQWSVGGNFGERETERPYTQSPYSLQVDPTYVQVIQNLISARANAKRKREFELADALRDELIEDYNVEVDDRQRIWTVGGNFGFDDSDRQEQAPYTIAPASTSPEQADYIQDRVEAREQARKERNFSMADKIRDELMDDYDVMVDDKLRQWAVGGMFGVKKAAGPGDSYIRRGGGDLSEQDIETIFSLIRERNDAKREKNFGKADRIRDQLAGDYNVSVDDRSREWMVVSADYAMSPGPFVNEELKAKIVKKISERSIAKLNKDYDIADSIRDELISNYNVYIDDRVREWKIEGPSSLYDEDEDVNEGDYDGDDNDNDGDDNDNDDYDDEEDEELIDDWEEEVAVEETTENSSMSNGNGNSNVDLESLTVVELKERLRLAGLPVSGKKSDLIQRLAN